MENQEAAETAQILDGETNSEQITQVLIQVVDVRDGREIGWGDNLAERLGERAADVRAAIRSGAATVAEGLRELPGAQGWTLGEVQVAFGIVLTAEAGVLLSKAGGQATFEVAVTYQRDRAS